MFHDEGGLNWDEVRAERAGWLAEYREIVALRAEVERLRMAEAEAMAVVYSLEGTVERLRADAERYRWLRAACASLLLLTMRKEEPMTSAHNAMVTRCGDTIRVNEAALWRLQMLLGRDADPTDGSR
jgi:hypothetical protein